MAIYFDEKEQVFMLHTPNTTYAIAITDGSYLCHLYYGKKVQSSQIRYLLKEDEPPYVPSKHRRETNAFLDTIPMEYPETGMGDYRESAFCVRSVRGHRASACAYKGYEIKSGKPKLAGMPATFADEDTCSTLYIYCKDPELPALALATRDDLASYAYAVSGASALRVSCRLGVAIHLIGGILGILIMAVLAFLGTAELLTPTHILLYQLIWLVPGLLVTEWTRAV